MNELPADTPAPNKGAERPTITLISIIVLTAATLLCYLPMLLNDVAHSIAVLHPEGSECIHMYATWDARWNDDLPAALDLRGQAEKDYDTVSSASSVVGGFDGPCLERFSPGALQILEACPWCGNEEVREKADKWNTFCFYASGLGVICALFAGIFLDFLRRIQASFPARSALWIAGLAFSLIYIGNSLMHLFAGWGVILPHWSVLLGSAILVAFLTSNIVLLSRMLRAGNRP